MKTIYKILFGFCFVLFAVYLVSAQRPSVPEKITGRIVVSTQGASVGVTANGPSLGVLFPSEFIPLPKGRCDVVIASPVWAGEFQYNQNIQVSEAKNTTASRNTNSCGTQLITIQGNTYGQIVCDAKINLDGEYYLMRVDFRNPVPYFTASYQCEK